jgi:hypothetical protein
MRIKICILIIFLSITSFSQTILRKVYTDKTIYTYGDTALITIRAINTSLVQDTIIFPNSCGAYPFINNINYLMTFGIGCAQILSPRIIPPQDSIEWVYEYPHPSNPSLYLPIGQHNVFGHFRLMYFNPDTFIISNTDTIGFLVEEASSVVVNESNQFNYWLEQNYPNPFNPITIISYQIPKTGKVTLKIFDCLGNEIETLVDKFQNEGMYKIEVEASKLSSGIYFYQLIADEFISTKKMIVLH